MTKLVQVSEQLKNDFVHGLAKDGGLIKDTLTRIGISKSVATRIKTKGRISSHSHALVTDWLSSDHNDIVYKNYDYEDLQKVAVVLHKWWVSTRLDYLAVLSKYGESALVAEQLQRAKVPYHELADTEFPRSKCLQWARQILKAIESK